MASSSIYGLCVAVNLLWFFAVEVSGVEVYTNVDDPMTKDEAKACTEEEVFSYGVYEGIKNGKIPERSYHVTRYSCAATKQRCSSSTDYPHYFELMYMSDILFAICGKTDDSVKAFAFKCKHSDDHVFNMYKRNDNKPGSCYTCRFNVVEGKKMATKNCEKCNTLAAKNFCSNMSGRVSVRRNAKWQGHIAVEMDETQ